MVKTCKNERTDKSGFDSEKRNLFLSKTHLEIQY